MWIASRKISSTKSIKFRLDKLQDSENKFKTKDYFSWCTNQRILCSGYKPHFELLMSRHSKNLEMLVVK